MPLMKRSSGRQAFVVLVAIAAIVIPATLGGAFDSFDDVSESNAFHDDIAAIANAGVTTGCGGFNYCPRANVTRQQMAKFMNNLGALSADKDTVVNAFMLNDAIFLNDSSVFTLAGGAAEECGTVTFTDDPNVGFAIPFGAYTVHHQLYAAPVATSLVNVQIEDSPLVADEDDDVYDVCFRTVDGSNLTAGDYETYRQLVVFFEGNIFGVAGAGASSTGDRESPLSRAGR